MRSRQCVVTAEAVSRMSKCYSDVILLPTFRERYDYLNLNGRVGLETFGRDRYLNQILYHSPEWRRRRRDIILRDNGCDLACTGYDIHGKVIIHHLNPITVQDILDRNPMVFDPENLICVSDTTHQAIHYGDERMLVTEPIIRAKNDTCPWR